MTLKNTFPILKMKQKQKKNSDISNTQDILWGECHDFRAVNRIF